MMYSLSLRILGTFLLEAYKGLCSFSDTTELSSVSTELRFLIGQCLCLCSIIATLASPHLVGYQCFNSYEPKIKKGLGVLGFWGFGVLWPNIVNFMIKTMIFRSFIEISAYYLKKKH